MKLFIKVGKYISINELKF